VFHLWLQNILGDMPLLETTKWNPTSLTNHSNYYNYCTNLVFGSHVSPPKPQLCKELVYNLTRCCRMNTFFQLLVYMIEYKNYYDKIIVVNIIMHKNFTTNFMVWRRTQKLHVIGLQIGLHIFFVQQNDGKQMFFQ
jgi:hypothetical protein